MERSLAPSREATHRCRHEPRLHCRSSTAWQYLLCDYFCFVAVDTYHTSIASRNRTKSALDDASRTRLFKHASRSLNTRIDPGRQTKTVGAEI